MKKKTLFAVALLSGLFLVSCSKKEEAVAEEASEVVKVLTLQEETISRELEFTTTLKPYDKVAVSPAMAGRIANIYVKEGDYVSKGQLLVKMDETNYLKTKLEFENIKVDFERISALNENNNVAKQTYDQMKAKYDIYKTSLENLEENTYLRAPFSGVITEKNYENGELFTQMNILTLMKIDYLKAYISVPETYLPILKKGSEVVIYSDIYADVKFNATIETIFPTIDPSTHTFQVLLRVPNGKNSLRPGMFVRTKLELGKTKAILVPYQSVLKLQGSNDRYMYKVVDGRAKRIDVLLGQRVDDRVEIISDEVKEGEQVVVVGQARLVDDVKLNIVE